LHIDLFCPLLACCSLTRCLYLWLRMGSALRLFFWICTNPTNTLTCPSSSTTADALILINFPM